MPVLDFLLVVVVIVLGAAAAALYLAYVTCAAALAAVCAVAAYGVGLPIAYLVSLGQVLVVRSPALTEPGWWPELPENADPAILQYFYGPALADAVHAAGVAQAHGRELWRYGRAKVRSCFSADLLIITAPLGAGAFLGMAAGTALGATAGGLCAVVDLLAIAVSATCVRVAGLIVRGADSAVLRVENIKMTCPHCHERIIYPSMSAPRRTALSATVTYGRAGLAFCGDAASAASQWPPCCCWVPRR